jgi:hypothetical protein
MLRRRTGRGFGRCGGTARPRSGRAGRGWRGPFAWVPADLGYGDRQASVWRAWPSARVARRPPGNGGALDGVRALPAKGKNFSFRGCIRRSMGHPPGPTTCTAVRGAPPLRKKVVNSQRTTKARRSLSLPLLTYSRLGALRQDPGRAAELAAGPKRAKTWGHDVRVLLSTYGLRGDEPLVGLAVGLRALGAEVRVCALPDSSEGRQREMRTCATRGSTGLEAPVIRSAGAGQPSTAASEISR